MTLTLAFALNASTGVLVAVTTIVSKKYSGVFSAANAVVPHTTLVLISADINTALLNTLTLFIVDFQSFHNHRFSFCSRTNTASLS